MVRYWHRFTLLTHLYLALVALHLVSYGAIMWNGLPTDEQLLKDYQVESIDLLHEKGFRGCMREADPTFMPSFWCVTSKGLEDQERWYFETVSIVFITTMSAVWTVTPFWVVWVLSGIVTRSRRSRILTTGVASLALFGAFQFL